MHYNIVLEAKKTSFFIETKLFNVGTGMM